MKIEILFPLASDHKAYEVGEVVQWDAADAARLIEKGYAKAVEKPGVGFGEKPNKERSK